MSTVVVCVALGAGFLAVLAVGAWRDYLITLELADRQAEYEHAVAEALDMAYDPDHEDFRQWAEELGSP